MSVSLFHRFSVRLRRENPGHMSSFPESLWLIFLPLTPFFCDLNIMVTNIVAWKSASVAVLANMRQPGRVMVSI